MRIAIVITLFVGALIGAITASVYHSRDDGAYDVSHRGGNVVVQCPTDFRAEDSCRATSDFARGGWTFSVTTVNP